MDNAGKLLWIDSWQVSAGNNHREIDLSSNGAGIYFVQLVDREHAETVKILKQ